ncbi:uncharacterized protein LOC127079505 [Lathyrus oleraceus]|uniref:uncharacterized protein LOC127079505 n=1 Tax=Pisum sativum TaxID=3888 RepID=UPI0021D2CA35|nr:uncharacterized protein LOC127079505 [Pisum sativum]
MSLKLKYLSQFPVFLHQYIDDIVDMEDNGNYGFRVIPTLHGWNEESWHLIQMHLDIEVYQHHQLYFNLFYETVPEVRSAFLVDGFGVHGREKWMMIPDMGYLIASIYNVIPLSLSTNLDITFFPLVIVPCISSSSHKMIALGFVNNNHWVQVKLKPNCPLPPVTERCRQNCSEVAKACESA